MDRVQNSGNRLRTSIAFAHRPDAHPCAWRQSVPIRRDVPAVIIRRIPLQDRHQVDASNIAIRQGVKPFDRQALMIGHSKAGLLQNERLAHEVLAHSSHQRRRTRHEPDQATIIPFGGQIAAMICESCECAAVKYPFAFRFNDRFAVGDRIGANKCSLDILGVPRMMKTKEKFHVSVRCSPALSRLICRTRAAAENSLRACASRR